MKIYVDANIVYDLLLNFASSRKFLEIDMYGSRGFKRAKYLYSLVYTKDELSNYVKFEDLIRNEKIRVFTSKYAEFEAFGKAYKDDFLSFLIGRINFPLPYVTSRIGRKSTFRNILKRHIANYENGEEMADWCIEFPPSGVGISTVSDIYNFVNYVDNESIDFSKEDHRDIISELCRFNMLASDIVHIIICKQNNINYLLTKDRDFHDLKNIIRDGAGIIIIKSLKEIIDLSRKG